MRERSSNAEPARPRAVLVDPDIADRASAAHWLTEAGFDVSQAIDFEDARRLIEIAAPALVVAAARLGAYNGFHLIIAARGGGRNVAGIVTTRQDEAGVRTEAERLGVGYLAKPLIRESFLELVGGGATGPSYPSVRAPLS